MSRRLVLSRRTFLHGAGTVMALPLLEAMLPWTRSARAQAAARRLLVYYVPNGMHMPAWTPATTGAGFALSPILAPLGDLRDDVLVLSGLANKPAEGDLGDHARGTASFLSCRTIFKTEAADIRNGISMDQVLAGAVGGATTFPSLQLGGEGGGGAGNCDSGYSCAYARNISWADDNSPLAKETNPQFLFDRLFGGQSGATPEQRARRLRYRQSVLDYVREDALRLQARLGRTDQQKLDEYLTGVRELERRLGAGAAVCEATAPAPSEDHPALLRAMADLIVLAFKCDLTRVVTFMAANAATNVNFPHLGIADGHHQISHHQDSPVLQAQLQTIDTWEIGELAYLLNGLKSVQEGDATLLDNSLVLFSSEIEDGNSHSHRNLPVLLAGRAGGAVTPGRHGHYDGEPPLANLYVTMLGALGVPTSTFGTDGTAPLLLA